MERQEFNAWNPGVESETPAEFQPLETLFCPQNSFSTLEETREYAALTGLPPEALTAFKPRRLVLHELIVRVTADIIIPEGDREEDLGIAFRQLIDEIMQRWIDPRLAEIETTYQQLREECRTGVARSLEQLYRPTKSPASEPPTSLFQRLLGRRRQPATAPASTFDERLLRSIAEWREASNNAATPFARAVAKGLYRVVGGLAGRNGQLTLNEERILELAARLATNQYASRRIGELFVDSALEQAIDALGLQRYHVEKKPVLVSLKGPSAAGKSHMRPRLQSDLRELGLEKAGYITISPDIWRRQLLDYDSLGEAHKYAGRLTSREVMVIDGKLDRHIRRRARRDGSIPHMLVDRFRFDSFESEKVARVLHKTYVQHVDHLVMYFIVTPPEATVERGWQRGLERGRYKSVDDFLDHAREAYQGMPRILFKWLAYDHPRFSYEFLDNSVPKEQYPALIARGDQQRMEIHAPLGLVSIERFQKTNIHAKRPSEVYPSEAELQLEHNLGFLRQCLKRIPEVLFVDPIDGRVYARVAGDCWEIVDSERFKQLRAADEELDHLMSIIVHSEASP